MIIGLYAYNLAICVCIFLSMVEEFQAVMLCKT